MKHSLKYAGLLAILILAACQSEDLICTQMNDSNAVEIRAAIGGVEGGFVTRTNPEATDKTATEFNVGDKIRVGARRQSETELDSITYVYQDNGVWTVESQGECLKWEEDSMVFVASYPSSYNWNKVFDQSTKERIQSADYMTVEDTTLLRKSDGAVKLNFSRKTARIIVKIAKMRESVANATISSLTIEDDVENIYTPYRQGDGGVNSTYTMLLDDGDLSLSLSMSIGGNTLKAELPYPDGGYYMGHSYTISLSVGKDAITVGNVEVEDWSTGSTIPGGEATSVSNG